MSRRPSDWSPLAGSDLVPGDPDEVERIASRYAATARALRDQSARLRALAGDRGWESNAADEWRHQGREVAQKLEKVVDRYETAGRALRTYGGQLRGAQYQSQRALDLAQDAERRARAADRAIADEARRHAQAPPETPPPDTSHLRRQGEQAEGDLARARSLLRGAVRDRDAAATVAANAIEDITGSDGLDDGRFAGVRKWFGDRVEWLDRNLRNITDMAGWIATVASGLALAVGWIPVIGQLAAAVLTAIAALATLVALIGSLVMAMQGRAGWAEVGLNLFSLVTLGVGRAAVAGVKIMGRGARAAAQAGKTDELVAASVALRGGQVGGKTLRRMTIAARRQAKTQPGTGLTRDQMADALTHAPSRLPQAVRAAFNPVAMGREAVDGIRGLLQPQNWRAAQQASGAAHPLLDDAARFEVAQVGRLSDEARNLSGVRNYTNALTWQQNTLLGSNAASGTADALDKAGVFDGIKAETVTPPR
ncbi:MAG: hypothetical protein JWQ53_656 [Klenkia sp.]|nr:hypothetical protein [Klenkia sp.]